MSTSTRITYRVEAPRERVYRAFVDASDVQKWMVPSGMTSTVHAFDMGTGKTSAQTDTYHGRFVELTPPERIVEKIEFETTNPSMRGEMTMTITLTALDDGRATELVAVHSDLPPALSAADNELGWRSSLAKLARLVEAE